MVNPELGRQFDVVLCLFSSIGYVRTRALLKKTLFSFVRGRDHRAVVEQERLQARGVTVTKSATTT
jgi:hypothetical protein